jgi:predicted outer membrane protein
MLEKIHDTQTMITKTYNNSVIEIDAGKKKRKKSYSIILQKYKNLS